MKLLTIIMLLCLVGCGNKNNGAGTLGADGKNGKDAASCTVVSTLDGLEVRCPDGSVQSVKNGAVGERGDPGSDGQSCSITNVAGGALITCGFNSVVVLNGINGVDGQTGSQGPQGEAGAPGKDAEPTAYPVIETIDPCGYARGYYNEVLLRLDDRRLIAFFENGGNRFLTELTPGNFQTTDGTGCKFTVTEDLEVKW